MRSADDERLSDMDLIAFLRAQLDEDERVAREATTGPWAVKPADSVYVKPSAVVLRTDVDVDAPWSNEWVSAYVVNPQEEGGEGIDPVDAEHIARWDPARVLAEVEAKRRIIDEYEDYVSDDDEDYERAQFASTSASAFETAIRLLAQPYAGRDGWREEWAL